MYKKNKKIIIAIIVIVAVIISIFAYRYIHHEIQINQIRKEFKYGDMLSREDIEEIISRKNNIRMGDTMFSPNAVMMFAIVPILIFGAVILIIALIIIKSVKQISYNNSQPKLTVDAKVLGKRTDVRGHDMTHTYYFVTFEVESGDRMEFEMQGGDFGMLIQGDSGKLTFQGNKYFGFKRV